MARILPQSQRVFSAFLQKNDVPSILPEQASIMAALFSW